MGEEWVLAGGLLHWRVADPGKGPYAPLCPPLSRPHARLPPDEGCGSTGLGSLEEGQLSLSGAGTGIPSTKI